MGSNISEACISETMRHVWTIPAKLDKTRNHCRDGSANLHALDVFDIVEYAVGSAGYNPPLEFVLIDPHGVNEVCETAK